MGQFLKLRKIFLVLGFLFLGSVAVGRAFADGFTLSDGRKAYDHQNYEKAKEFFQQKVQKNPADADDAYALGNSLYRLGQYEDAAQAYEKALQQSPGLEPGWYNLGNSLFQQQEYKDAVDAYQKALALKPGDQDAAHNLQLAKEKLKNQPKNRKEKNKNKDTKKKGSDQSSAPSNSPQNQSLSGSPSRKQGNQQSKSGSSPQPSGSSPQDSKNQPGSNPSSSQPTEDQQRQAEAKKELGLSDKQVQALLEKMQKQEHQTQQYFSLNPKKEQQNVDPMWGMIPKEQRALMQQLLGKRNQDGKNEPEEDW
jgi:Ca-activated chloride channel family protein